MRKLFLALFLAPIVVCSAQDALPSAESVLNRYMDAIGGRAVLEKRHNQVEHGTVEIAAMGVKGDVTIYEAEPNKNLMVIDLTGIGKIESGTDGTVAWENNPLQGPRIKQGVESIDTLRDATFNAPLSMQKLYSKMETTGAETTEGHDCYKVVLTAKEGNPTTEYYDKTSGFLIKTSATRTTAMGDVTVDMVYDDYRKDGDEVLPHKLTQRAAQMEVLIVIAKTDVNVELPKDVFDLPPDIQALVNKTPQAAAKASAPPAASAPGSGKLTIYMGGKPTESESYTVQNSDGKIMLSGSGHAAIGPMKVDIDEFNIVTDEKFQPIEAAAKGKMGQIQMNVKTSFAAGKATNQVDNGQGVQTKEDPVHPDAIVVYNPFPFYPWTVSRHAHPAEESGSAAIPDLRSQSRRGFRDSGVQRPRAGGIRGQNRGAESYCGHRQNSARPTSEPGFLGGRQSQADQNRGAFPRRGRIPGRLRPEGACASLPSRGSQGSFKIVL